MTQTAQAEWVTKGTAQDELHISRTKLDLLMKKHNLHSERDPMDERVRLVNLTELKRLLAPKR